MRFYQVYGLGLSAEKALAQYVLAEGPSQAASIYAREWLPDRVSVRLGVDSGETVYEFKVVTETRKTSSVKWVRP